jgi:diguanylate cyclase (GGDEF)-like protein/PAS domain S-box-containing protein
MPGRSLYFDMPANIPQASRAPFDTATFILPAEWHTLADLFGGTDTGVLMLQDGQILQLNAALAARLGYEPDELTGRPVETIIPQRNNGTATEQNWPQQLAEAAPIILQDKWGATHGFHLLENRIDPLSDARCNIWVLRPLATEDDVLADSGARLLALTEQLPDLVLIADTDAHIRYANRAFDTLTGGRRHPLPALVHADDREVLQQALTRAAAAESAPLALRIRRADGGWSHVAGTVSNLLSHPDVQGLLLNVRDVSREITEQQRGECERKRHLHYLNRLLRIAQRPQANLETALKVIVKSAAKALALHRCSYWEFDEGALPRCLLAYDDLRQNFIEEAPDALFERVFQPLMRKVIDDGRQLAVSDVDQDPRAALYCEYFHAAGIKALTMVPVERPRATPGLLLLSSIEQPRPWRKDETEFADSVAYLITTVLNEVERSHSESRLRDVALHDKLTGLPNQDFLLRQAADIFPRLSAQTDTLATFFIDLDGFTEVNDKFGLLLGDELLKAAALRLKNTVRRNDVLVRLSGDRFLLLARELGELQVANELAQQIVDNMCGVFALQGRELQISASVGVALYPYDGADLDALMKKADSALHRAKSAGRGQYRMFAARAQDGDGNSETLRAQLRDAIARRELQHYYQPQVDLRNGEVRAVEAMLRWQHPQHGLLLPASFLPLAEESGLMQELNGWVLDDVCAQIADWSARGIDGFTVAVNLSARQLADSSLQPTLDAALRRHDVPAQRLEWEVRECDMMQHDTQTKLLERVTDTRVGLSIDGVCATDTGYLRHYPVRKLKIECTASDTHDGGGSDIADAVIAVAHPMGLDVVAKGVETSQQIEYLRERGCDIAQGYFYTQPLTAGQLEKWLTRH